jgi:sterol desaturase/sphingolipid hydroxylase (fatty acid hydroxylase superfamily)
MPRANEDHSLPARFGQKWQHFSVDSMNSEMFFKFLLLVGFILFAVGSTSAIMLVSGLLMIVSSSTSMPVMVASFALSILLMVTVSVFWMHNIRYFVPFFLLSHFVDIFPYGHARMTSCVSGGV